MCVCVFTFDFMQPWTQQTLEGLGSTEKNPITLCCISVNISIFHDIKQITFFVNIHHSLVVFEDMRIFD